MRYEDGETNLRYELKDLDSTQLSHRLTQCLEGHYEDEDLREVFVKRINQEVVRRAKAKSAARNQMDESPQVEAVNAVHYRMTPSIPVPVSEPSNSESDNESLNDAIQSTLSPYRDL